MCVYVSDVCGQEQIPRRAIQHQAHLSLLPIGCRGFLLRSLMCMVVSTYVCVCVCACARVRAGRDSTLASSLVESDSAALECPRSLLRLYPSRWGWV